LTSRTLTSALQLENLNKFSYKTFFHRFEATWDFIKGSVVRGGFRPPTLENITGMESPRYVKSHLPLNLLPRQINTRVKRPQIIYVARNPKDVCVSFYHYRVLFQGYHGTLDDFVQEFVADLCEYLETNQLNSVHRYILFPSMNSLTIEVPTKRIPTYILSYRSSIIAILDACPGILGKAA